MGNRSFRILVKTEVREYDRVGSVDREVLNTSIASMSPPLMEQDAHAISREMREVFDKMVRGAIANFPLALVLLALAGCAVEGTGLEKSSSTSTGVTADDADGYQPPRRGPAFSDAGQEADAIQPDDAIVATPDTVALPADSMVTDTTGSSPADGPVGGCPPGEYTVVKDMPLPRSDATVRAYSCSPNKQDAGPEVPTVPPDPGCTEDGPPLGSVFPDCMQYAYGGSCVSVFTQKQGYCRATCLVCNPGCTDVPPPWVPEMESATPTCAKWVAIGACSNVGNRQYICRASCGLCAP